MKIFKRLLLLVLLLIVVIIYLNYPRLNIISGYSAKMTNSSIFIGNRNLEFTNATDNNFSPVNIAKDEVDTEEKITEASVYGFMKRKAFYREGLGSVLINDDFDIHRDFPKPKRTRVSDTIPFPYGNGEATDSVFSNINYRLLNKVIDSAFDNTGENIKKTRSVLVVYKDHIIAEKYADGFDKNSKLLGWSMTKSWLSTLYGILQCQGEINIENAAPIEEWKNDDRSQITINHLLNMSSGLEWEENYEKISDVTKMLFLEENMSRSQLIKPLSHKPGENFYYSSGTTNLLSGILRKQFKNYQAYIDFPYKNFFDRIGMNSALIETDMSGNFVGSSYGWATTRDWAKFGLLYLHKGNWNGDQVFEESWIKNVTESYPSSNGTYATQFWQNDSSVMPDVPTDVYYADGFQGQRVFIIPSHDMVIVRLGLSNINFNKFLKEVINSVETNK
ncbi:serine hydrolase domain-containing protein [Abyssalbus ytuae]|uniref:Beta-lactamase family protein n=1 Tax=Abyssalbus ytuae TaxID=2926907 RepID=A0A9E6ZNR5_9FLAO|nr:serine hydrolase [Abyssalbus ytuae]UOB15918.1 beta-lactamase family protein [Abyssalbus ytuae]